MRADLLFETGEVVFALAASNNLPVALRGQHIATEGELGPLRVVLHVESLNLGRIAMDKERLIKEFREDRLLVAAEIIPPRHGDISGLEVLHGLVVAYARVRFLGRRLERRDVPPQRLKLPAALAYSPADNGRHVVLGQVHDCIEVGVGDLRLDHPELREVASGLRLLGAESRPKAVDPAESHRGRLHVELAALSQESRLAEVVGGEKRRGAFARRRGEDGGVYEGEAPLVEVVPAGLNHGASDLKYGVLADRAQPEVAVVHEEGHPVLLGTDGVARGELDHIERLDPQLVADGASGIGPNVADHHEARLLSDGVGALKDLRAHVGPGDHALDRPRAVPHLEKVELSRGALAIEPAFEGDGSALVAGYVGYVDVLGQRRSPHSRPMHFNSLTAWRRYHSCPGETRLPGIVVKVVSG